MPNPAPEVPDHIVQVIADTLAVLEGAVKALGDTLLHTLDAIEEINGRLGVVEARPTDHHELTQQLANLADRVGLLEFTVLREVTK